jgi:hypothetical protein
LLSVDPLEALGQSLGSVVFQRLDVYSLIRVGQVCRYVNIAYLAITPQLAYGVLLVRRAWRELSMRDRLWANDCYRLPPSHTPSDQFRSYQPSTHRGRAFRDICYSTFLDSTPPDTDASCNAGSNRDLYDTTETITVQVPMHEMLISSHDYEKALVRYPDNLSLYINAPVPVLSRSNYADIAYAACAVCRRRLVEKASASLSLFSGKPAMQDWRATDVSEPVIATCEDFYAPMYVCCVTVLMCVRACVRACVTLISWWCWRAAGRTPWWSTLIRSSLGACRSRSPSRSTLSCPRSKRR